MVPRSIIESTIDRLALRVVTDRCAYQPDQMADLYINASRKIREKLEAEFQIDETK